MTLTVVELCKLVFSAHARVNTVARASQTKGVFLSENQDQDL